MALLSNRNRVAYRSLRPPDGPTLSHETGEYGYQYTATGLTITNTSRDTAVSMSEAYEGIVAFHMRTWRRYKQDGYPTE